MDKAGGLRATQVVTSWPAPLWLSFPSLAQPAPNISSLGWSSSHWLEGGHTFSSPRRRQRKACFAFLNQVATSPNNYTTSLTLALGDSGLICVLEFGVDNSKDRFWWQNAKAVHSKSLCPWVEGARYCPWLSSGWLELPGQVLWASVYAKQDEQTWGLGILS